MGENGVLVWVLQSDCVIRPRQINHKSRRELLKEAMNRSVSLFWMEGLWTESAWLVPLKTMTLA